MLANISESLPKEEVYKIIEEVVTTNYEKQKDRIKNAVEKYNRIWDKYNDVYFETLSNYLNVNWPDEINIIDASVGLTPVFPRYLDLFSFSLAPNLNDLKVVETAAHESLHFLWFIKWKQLYPECPRREYDSPYIPWQYSEMVVDPILNSEEIKSILNIDERTYDSFYEIKDRDSSMIDNLREIYASDKNIELKISIGFDYIKSVLENKVKK